MLNLFIKRCYPISKDGALIVTKYFGISNKKIKIISLGVDTDLFRPADNDELNEKAKRQRLKLGFKEDDIICIYTGRLTEGKQPLVLAKAIKKLNRKYKKYRGLFVGHGSENYCDKIRSQDGCVVHPFVPVQELPVFYQLSDIAVWPVQESTSQLDAAACGLPLILSHKIMVTERIEDNGYVYKEGDVNDLSRKIIRFSCSEKRKRMGALGSGRISNQFSWDKIAKEYIEDYGESLTKAH